VRAGVDVQEQKNQKKKKYDRKIRGRVIVLMAIFGILMFVPLVMQLYDISIKRHDELEKLAIEQQTKSFPIGADRGTIYDRNGKPLAISATVHTVCIAPNKIKDDAEALLIAEGLSALLEVDREFILERAAKKHRANEIIKKNIEKEKMQEVVGYINENKYSQQIFLEPSSKRYYPNNSFASNIIGFVGADNSGLVGLEAKYDEQMTGQPGYTISARDPKGNPLPNQYEMYYDAQDGSDLILTIDQKIQYFVEKSLGAAVIENDVSQRACAIVMDVKTGGILGMSTKGDFDLNDPFLIADKGLRKELEGMKGDKKYDKSMSDARQAQWRNKAINDTYEPGSTFKVFTAAMAIEEKTVDLANEKFYCSGSVKVEGWGVPIKCHKKGGHGSQTFAETLMHSCNPAYISIGRKVGGEKFYQYMGAFGFFNKTGIDLQGEAGSIVSSYEQYKKDIVSQAVYSFGQTFKVTPIQMITAVCAVANGGELMKPHVVSQIVDKNGHVEEYAEPAVSRKVISEETSKIMRDYMEQCVINGTGSNAYVKGYRVAGKTGTSQKRDVKGADDQGWYVVSFMGFAPADDPQIAVLVMLDQPGGPRVFRTGGFLAAPVAGRIFADALPHLGVAHQYTAQELLEAEVTVPFVKGKSVKDAKSEAEKAGLAVKVEGNGKTVKDQLPLNGSLVPADSELVLYTKGVRPGRMITVPHVVGKSPEEANRILIDAGLVMRPIGAQQSAGGALEATWQEHSGEKVPYGQVVQVEFRTRNVADY